MTDAFIEFLTENKQRTYPFAEGSSLVSVEGPTLANDVVLDLISIHRTRRQTMRLLAVVAPESAGSVDFPAVTGKITFYFALGETGDRQTASFSVEAQELPLDSWHQSADSNYPGICLSKTRATFGPGLADIPADAFWTFTDLRIEPSLVVSLYRNQIDLVKLVHLVGDDEIVGGNIKVFGGYNVDVYQSSQSIRISPSLGGGVLGRFTRSISDGAESKCTGALFSINGQPPNEQREFFITGGKGIEVVNLPDEHKVRIRLEPARLGGTICTDD